MVPRAYYNEFDRRASAWLRQLIAEGVIAPGDVDERSIHDVLPSDLAGYTQCHFFAGIGGWSYALRLAGWSDASPVWTGSAPCQPFSIAGKGKGTDDKRHLWPEFYRLIEACQPATVFGEQVASPAGLDWIDSLQADLERSGYEVGAADLCAAGIGAPQIRQRFYWVGHANRDPGRGSARRFSAPQGEESRSNTHRPWAGSGNAAVGLADSNGIGYSSVQHCCAARLGAGEDTERTWIGLESRGSVGISSTTDGFWGAADWLYCRDARWRPVEPGTFPLADGIPARMGRLRGYGNAIVPQIAAEFVAAFMEVAGSDNGS